MDPKNSSIPIRINAANFTVPQSFDKSRDVPISCRADRKFKHMLSKAYENAKPKVHWETISDMYRWMVWRGVQELNQLLADDRIANEIAQVKLILNRVRDSEMDQFTMGAIDSLKKQVEELERNGDHSQVFHLLNGCLTDLKGMDPDKYMTKKMRRRFDELFSGYMRRGRISNRPRLAEREENE